jgi:hypothetical protein
MSVPLKDTRAPKNAPVEGHRFGRYVVRSEIEPEPRPNNGGNIRRVIVVCDCGTERMVHLQNLMTRKSESCGCLAAEKSTKRATIHGDAGSDEHHCWLGMLSRCSNPNATKYSSYGGRGIKVCDRWRESYSNFLADMGRKPTPQHSIDRYPDNDGNYEPTNCRWATKLEQRLNQRPRKGQIK